MMLVYWLISFLYFIIIFFSLIKNTVTDRKDKLALEQQNRIEEMKSVGESLANEN